MRDSERRRESVSDAGNVRRSRWLTSRSEVRSAVDRECKSFCGMTRPGARGTVALSQAGVRGNAELDGESTLMTGVRRHHGS